MPKALVAKVEEDFDDEEDACKFEACDETFEVQVRDNHRDDKGHNLPSKSFHKRAEYSAS